MDVKNQEVLFFIGRVNKMNGRKEYIQVFNDELFRRTPDESGATKYTDAKDAGIIVNHLNAIAEQLGHEHYYFSIKSIDDKTVITNGMPDEVLQWFNTGEEEEPAEDKEESAE